MDDDTLAQLNNLIGMMDNTQSLDELSEIAGQIASLGEMPADRKAQASAIYRDNMARIKAAMAAE